MLRFLSSRGTSTPAFRIRGRRFVPSHDPCKCNAPFPPAQLVWALVGMAWTIARAGVVGRREASKATTCSPKSPTRKARPVSQNQSMNPTLSLPLSSIFSFPAHAQYQLLCLFFSRLRFFSSDAGGGPLSSWRRDRDRWKHYRSALQ
jgi:hypothetical protein